MKTKLWGNWTDHKKKEPRSSYSSCEKAFGPSFLETTWSRSSLGWESIVERHVKIYEIIRLFNNVWANCTPWKINMEHKNGGLEDDFPFQFGDF